jgi:hypothetical protein
VPALLVVEAVGFAVVGFWALAAPRSFYDGFPGGGHAWVAPDGPVTEHLVRDVGALNLALVTVLVAAAWWGGAALVRTACAAALVWSVPHVAYHLAHLDPLPSAGDKVAEAVSLGLAVVAPLVVLWLVRRTDASTATA